MGSSEKDRIASRKAVQRHLHPQSNAESTYRSWELEKCITLELATHIYICIQCSTTCDNIRNRDQRTIEMPLVSSLGWPRSAVAFPKPCLINWEQQKSDEKGKRMAQIEQTKSIEVAVSNRTSGLIYFSCQCLQNRHRNRQQWCTEHKTHKPWWGRQVTLGSIQTSWFPPGPTYLLQYVKESSGTTSYAPLQRPMDNVQESSQKAWHLSTTHSFRVVSDFKAVLQASTCEFSWTLWHRVFCCDAAAPTNCIRNLYIEDGTSKDLRPLCYSRILTNIAVVSTQLINVNRCMVKRWIRSVRILNSFILIQCQQINSANFLSLHLYDRDSFHKKQCIRAKHRFVFLWARGESRNIACTPKPMWNSDDQKCRSKFVSEAWFGKL